MFAVLAVIQSVNFVELEEKIVNYFALLKEREAVGSSYIFIGDNPSVIDRLLKVINCVKSKTYCQKCWSCVRVDNRRNPDLMVVKPEGLSIKIESIREGIRFLSLKSYYCPKKILIVEKAHKMSQEASNLFLKTLEEPPNDCVIGLLVPKLGDVLPTITSRCRKIYLPWQEKKVKVSFFSGKKPFIPAAPSLKNRKDFALFLENLILSLHSQLKELLFKGKDEGFLGLDKLIEGIEETLKIYKAHHTININLALNLIRMRLQ